MKQEIILIKFEEKKNSVRYNSPDENNGILKSVYLMKRDLPQPYPQKVKVTVEAA